MEIRELSIRETTELYGGDWLEKMGGFMVATAFIGGALAAPELLAVAAMTGASIMAIEAILTWY